MNFPFTYESVESGLVSRKLAISRNKIASNVFTPVTVVTLLENGKADGAEGWLVKDGAIRVDMGPQGGFYEFGGVESRNGVVYAVGLHSCEKACDYRAVMSVVVPMGNDFGVSISSNKDYEKDTIPVIAKSLRKAGVDKDSVVVVVGSNRDDRRIEMEREGLLTIKTNDRAEGMNALGEVSARNNVKYWVLLHDTCTVSSDFKDKIQAIDTGLNPDIVLFSKLEDKIELGVYSSDYLSKGVVDLSRKPRDTMNGIIDEAKVIVEAIAIPSSGKEKDVYGCGVMRKAMEMEAVGITKNRRKIRGGKRRP